MKKEHRVLITGIGGNIGQGILKSLRASSYSFHVTGIDLEPLSAGFSLVDHYERVPRTRDPEFDKVFRDLASRERIEAVYVCSPSELDYFSTHQRELEASLGLCVFVNASEVCRIGEDKLKTVDFLRQNKLPYPETAAVDDSKGIERLIQKYGFPLIVKPRKGFTSRNVFLIHSKKELEAAGALVPDLIVQQYLSEKEGEYTAGTISGPDRKVRACIVLKRHLLQGTTYRTELAKDMEIFEQVTRIAETLGTVGICNFQFRLVNKQVTIFEINPRFSGTSGIRYLYGFNDPELMFELFCLKKQIRRPQLRPGVVLRYWNEIFIPAADFENLQNGRRLHDGRQTVIPVPKRYSAFQKKD